MNSLYIILFREGKTIDDAIADIRANKRKN
jgi:hypothetical protein